MNTLEKQLPTGGTIPMGKAIKGNTRYLDSIIETSPRQAILKRRLSPQAGALKKLDAVEGRLVAARAAADEILFGRFYLAWLCLHRIAFNYGGER